LPHKYGRYPSDNFNSNWLCLWRWRCFDVDRLFFKKKSMNTSTELLVNVASTTAGQLTDNVIGALPFVAICLAIIVGASVTVGIIEAHLGRKIF